MRVLKEFLSGSRKAHGISNSAAVLIALVVLVLGGFVIKRLLWAAFVLLHWAFKIAVLLALLLLVAYIIKYLAKKME